MPELPEVQGLVDFLEQYRKAVEARNVHRMLDLASPAYLDDNGTPSGDDDLDYDSLREKLSSWRDRVLDVRYAIKYRRVTWEEHRVFVEYQYTASFRVTSADGEDHWSRRLGDNRIVLSREEDSRFKILSGM